MTWIAAGVILLTCVSLVVTACNLRATTHFNRAREISDTRPLPADWRDRWAAEMERGYGVAPWLRWSRRRAR